MYDALVEDVLSLFAKPKFECSVGCGLYAKLVLLSLLLGILFWIVNLLLTTYLL
jgi:hypothetical protein